MNFVIQPQVLIPTSEIKETNGISFGGYISYENPLAEKLRLLISYGGGLFQGKKFVLNSVYEDTYPAIAFMQLRPGIKYFVTEKHLWVSALIGIGYSFKKGETSLGFSYAPSLGYAISKKFDIAVRYDATSYKNYSANGVGFNLGYHLGN